MKKIISVIVLSVFFLTSCGKTEVVVETSVKPKYVKTQIMEEQWFSEDIKLIGKIAGFQETSIAPLTSGMIKKVEVKVGDSVKAGDTLAVIDTQSNLTNINLNNAQNTYNNTLTVYNASKEAIEKNLDTAKLQYENAISSRDNTYASTQKQLELVQAQLDAVSKQKTNTTTTSQTSLSLAQESLTNAELNLDNFNKNYTETFKSFDVKRNSLLNNMMVTIDSSMATIDLSLNSIDNILGVTEINKHANDDYELYLWVKNTTYKNQAENIFAQANTTYQDLKVKYNQNISNEDLLSFYEEVMKLNNVMISLFEKMIWVLDNSITSTVLTETTLSGLKTTIKGYQWQVISLKSTLVGLSNSLNDLDTTITSTKISLATQKSSIEQSISIAKATLENTKASLTTSLDSISSQENTTKVQLESTLASIKSSREAVDNAVKIANNQYIAAQANYESQLASTKSQLDSASGQKNSVSQQFDNAIIKAPFDGIISTKSVEVGSMVSQASPAFSISSSKQKIIKIDVNSDNIVYLQYGKEVKIEVKGKTATGFISALSTSADPTTKMYKVEIGFQDVAFNDAIVIGDYADVYINKTYGEAKYIVVPFSAIIVGSNDTYSVYVVDKNNKVQERKITTGPTNSTQVVVTTGLNVGDKVIVWWTLNVSVWDLVAEM